MTTNALEQQSAAGRPSASSDRPVARSAGDFFYKSASHQAALNEMLAAIKRRDGIIVLTGEPGCGKSTLCQVLRKELGDDPFAMIAPDASRSREDLQKALLVHFGVVTTADLEGPLLGATEVELCSQLYQFINFPSTPRATVLVFDEAERVEAILEEVAAFSDLESEEKLLQVVLVGPPSLRQQLTPEVLKKVGPRTPAWCELKPLTPEEVAAYVRHRLAASGAISERIHFSNDALEFIAQHSSGLPRAINDMCDRAIERADLVRASRIDRKIVSTAVYGELGEPPAAPSLSQLDIPIPAHADRRKGNDVDVSGLDVDFDPADLPATSGLASFDPAPEVESAKQRPRPYARRKPRFSVPPRTLKIASIATVCGVLALIGLRLWTFSQVPAVVEQPRPQPRAATVPRPAAPAAPTATAAAADATPPAAAPAVQTPTQPSQPSATASAGTAAQPGAPAPPAAAPPTAAPVVPAPVATRPASSASAPERVAAAGVGAAPPAASTIAASTPAAAKPAPVAPKPSAPPAPAPAATKPAPSAAAGPVPTARPLQPSAAPTASTTRAAAPSTAAAPAPAAARPAAPGNYLIEVATFRRPEGAATLIQELKALGLKAYDRQVNLGSRGLMRQVLVGPYDRETATSALARVQKLPDYGDARMRRVE